MNFFKKAFLVAAPALLVGSAANAALVNGGFETGNTSGWSTLGTVSASTGVSYGIAGTVLPDSGTYAALLNTGSAVSAASLAAAMGVSEATLEASNGGVNATIGSLLYQTTTANVGDSFRFRWNFVEQDYDPFDDWAFYGISFNGGPATVTKFASLVTVGPGPGTTINGWTTLNVNISVAGSYTFYFGIVDALDQFNPSSLWIDNVQAEILPPVTPSGVPDGGSGIALLGLAMTAAAGFRRKFGV